jgi:hypothetical protein
MTYAPLRQALTLPVSLFVGEAQSLFLVGEAGAGCPATGAASVQPSVPEAIKVAIASERNLLDPRQQVVGPCPAYLPVEGIAGFHQLRKQRGYVRDMINNWLWVFQGGRIWQQAAAVLGFQSAVLSQIFGWLRRRVTSAPRASWDDGR